MSGWQVAGISSSRRGSRRPRSGSTALRDSGTASDVVSVQHGLLRDFYILNEVIVYFCCCHCIADDHAHINTFSLPALSAWREGKVRLEIPQENEHVPWLSTRLGEGESLELILEEIGFLGVDLSPTGFSLVIVYLVNCV